MLSWIQRKGVWVLVCDELHLQQVDLAMVITETGTGVVVASVLGHGLPGQWSSEEAAKSRCLEVLKNVLYNLRAGISHLQKESKIVSEEC